MCLRDIAFANFLPVDEQTGLSSRAALSGPAVVEGDLQRVLAVRNRARTLYLVQLQAKEVVREDRGAVLDPEGPATEAAALREQHAMALVALHFDIGFKIERGILDIDERIFRHEHHARIDRQLGPPIHQIRPSGNLRVKPLNRPIVDR